MDYPKVCLRRGEEAGVLKGQKLIYDNELDWADDICTDGCVVDVLDSRQRFVARGFFNARSKLTVRVLTRRAEETIARDFVARRIRAAWPTASRRPARTSLTSPGSMPPKDGSTGSSSATRLPSPRAARCSKAPTAGIRSSICSA